MSLLTSALVLLALSSQQDLDLFDRSIDRPMTRSTCPQVDLAYDRGASVRLSPAARVNPAFLARLRRFEDTVREVATRRYGRAPVRIRQMGTYACRPNTNRAYRMSEHALGNAIDVAGFEFGPAPRKQKTERGVPRGAFSVTVARSWNSTSPAQALHASFLRELVQELRSRQVFRGMIGPPDPGHHNHLHLDGGPWVFTRLNAS